MLSSKVMLWNNNCEIRNSLSMEQPYSVCEATVKSNKHMIFKQTFNMKTLCQLLAVTRDAISSKKWPSDQDHGMTPSHTQWIRVSHLQMMISVNVTVARGEKERETESQVKYKNHPQQARSSLQVRKIIIQSHLSLGNWLFSSSRSCTQHPLHWLTGIRLCGWLHTPA